MQGRITGVLSARLGETCCDRGGGAGTRMFEDRRDKALKTGEGFEAAGDLQDTARRLSPNSRSSDREGVPRLPAQNDLERLTRWIVADYVRYQEKVQQSATDLEAKQRRGSGTGFG